MAIVPQYATATADASGDAAFLFVDVPLGELWCGTTQVPNAPATFIGIVTATGAQLGQMNGPGSYGPWTCDHSQRLAISASGLTPHAQYQAIWHADDKGRDFSTYPAPITPTAVIGPVVGTVDVGNFPAVQTVDGTVTALPSLAGSAPGGSVTMTGSAVTLPAHAATQGVVLSAPTTNVHGVSVNGGFALDPGQVTPLLPVSNSDVFAATGTGPDVLTFLVT